MTTETDEQRVKRQIQEDYDSLHPIHQRLKKQTDELIRVVFMALDLNDPNYFKLHDAINKLLTHQWRDGYDQALSTFRPDVYKQIMENKEKEEETERLQEECGCNQLSEEEMSRSLEYNNGKFECPDCGQLH